MHFPEVGEETVIKGHFSLLIRATMVLLCMLMARPALADGFDLLSVSALVKVGENHVLGKAQPESFREYDVMAAFRLPLEELIPADSWVQTRLLVGAGVLQSSGKTGVVVAAIPALAIATQDGRFSADVGLGAALLSRYRFGRQDFGGPLQFALTAGLSIPLYGSIGAGYRFMHYSDAGLHGSGTVGTDSHMAELIYRF